MPFGPAHAALESETHAVVHSAHSVAPCTAEYVPAAQFSHVVVALPSWSKRPAWQRKQSDAASEPGAEYDPTAQTPRHSVAPSAAENWPEAQFEQGVAASESASDWPAEQTTQSDPCSPFHPLPVVQQLAAHVSVPFQQLAGLTSSTPQDSKHRRLCATMPSLLQSPRVPPTGAASPVQSTHASPPLCPQWQSRRACVGPAPSATSTPKASCKLQRAVAGPSTVI